MRPTGLYAHLILIFCLLLIVPDAFSAPLEQRFHWPAHPVARQFEAFVSVFNTNDSNRMAEFVRANGQPDDAQTLARYWASVYAEYGELVPFSVDNAWSAEHRLALWLQGRVTKGWVMILLTTDAQTGRLNGKGVLRGHRPPVAVPPYQPASDTSLAEGLKKHMQQMDKYGLFSGSVRVARGERVIADEAIGLADHTSQIPNDVSTLFNTASVSKLLTAVGVMQLREQGKLSLSDALTKWLPEYPRDIAKQVTIEHLLTHTSGIELDDHGPFNEAIQQARTLDEVVAAHVTFIDHMNDGRRPEFKVLGEMDYSNENFHLLGAIIERASGLNYADYIRKHLFGPAGMTDALAHQNTPSQRAIGYTRRDENFNLQPVWADNTRFLPQMALPSCCVLLSVRDLHRFFLALNTHKLLNRQSLQHMLSAEATEYEDDNTRLSIGLGVNLARFGSAYAWGHSGDMQGAGAQTWYFPQQDMYVMVLGNTDPIATQHLYGWIRDWIAPLPLEG